jgi:hypothetical protein
MDPALCPSHYCSKYSTCEPTCAVVGPTCPAGRVCDDLFGVATCVPAADGGSSDGRANVNAPPAASCSCDSGCGPDQRCLQNQAASLLANEIRCRQPEGLAQCRARCGPDQRCPATRPFCVSIPLFVGCCTDYDPPEDLCCANGDAHDVTDCR